MKHGTSGTTGRLWRVLVAILALALVATACAEQDGGDVAEEPADGEAEEEPAGDEAPDEELTLAWIPWEDAIAITFLWKEILERKDYDVADQQLEVAAVFAGVADGTVDAYLDAWLPDTHASYEEKFGDQWVNLGTWFEPATLELTVPTYVAEEEGITSLEDLADNAELFDGEIVGIEAGAGMMELLREDVMPAYGLDEDFELVASSTPAMRADLQSAVDNEEPIVVTLWTPHPEYGLKDLTRLEDPEGAWGEPEHLDIIAREGFEEDFPDVAEWWGNTELDEEQLADLQALIEEAPDGEEQEAAAEWLDDNLDIVNEWLGEEDALEEDGGGS